MLEDFPTETRGIDGFQGGSDSFIQEVKPIKGDQTGLDGTAMSIGSLSLNNSCWGAAAVGGRSRHPLLE